MRKITKNEEPVILANWKKHNPRSTYADISSEIRQAIRLSCTKEQHYLCAYCCQSILGQEDTSNEHIISQNSDSRKSLEYTNIIASCKNKYHCNNARGHQEIDLTPLMSECEEEIYYDFVGNILGRTERAKELIEVLKLNHNSLKHMRRNLISTCLEPDDDNSIEHYNNLKDLCDYYETVEDGKLQHLAPILVYAIKDYLGKNY